MPRKSWKTEQVTGFPVFILDVVCKTGSWRKHYQFFNYELSMFWKMNVNVEFSVTLCELILFKCIKKWRAMAGVMNVYATFVLKKQNKNVVGWCDLKSITNLQTKSWHWFTRLTVSKQGLWFPSCWKSSSCSVGPESKPKCSICPQLCLCTFFMFYKELLEDENTFYLRKLGMCMLCRTVPVSRFLL